MEQILLKVPSGRLFGSEKTDPDLFFGERDLMTDLARLLDALAILRKEVSREMPIQQVALFLTVAGHPGVTMPELMRWLDMPQGTVSRNVKALSRYVERKEGVNAFRGYDLLETFPAPGGGQALSVGLTDKGREVAEALAKAVAADKEGEGLKRIGRKRGELPLHLAARH